MTTSTTYHPGQTVTLPARFQAEPGVTVTAEIRFIDEVDRFVRVNVAGYMQVVSFEELAQAVHVYETTRDGQTGRWGSRCRCGWYVSANWPTEQAARDYVQAKHVDREDNRDSAAQNITARVAAGAALLDSEQPGWDQRVTLDTLEISSCTSCVLGQLYGNVSTGYGVFGIDDDAVDQFGFDQQGWAGDEYELLTAEWRRVIVARRALAADPVEERLIDLAIDRITGDDEPLIDAALAEALGLSAEDEALAEHLAVLLLRMADGIVAEALARLHNDLQLPVAHATSWWQRPLGWFRIPTTAWCGKRIVARRVVGPSRECRECRRAVDGER